ncbi:MAG: hypothetical protein QM753_07695 [Thermomicrobiales bacterium]
MGRDPSTRSASHATTTLRRNHLLGMTWARLGSRATPDIPETPGLRGIELHSMDQTS